MIMFNFDKEFKYLLKLSRTSKLSGILFSYRSFIAAAGLLFVYSLIGTVFLECFYVTYDIWEHIPQIMAFKDNPFSPVDPYLRGDNTSHLLTPYHFLLGVAANLSGLSPLIIFYIAGLINLIFFLYSVKVLAAEYFGDRKYSLLVLTVLLFVWLYPPVSSGYYNFAFIPLTLGYPYRAVFPLLLLVIARYNNSIRAIDLVFYTIAGALAFASHPVTGGFIFLVMFLKSVLDRETGITKKAIPLLVPAVALLLTFLWPFYPILGFVTSANKLNVFNLPDAYKFYYHTVWTLLVLVVPALIMLKARIKEKKFDFIMVATMLLTPLITVNYFLFKNEPLARMIVFIALMFQLLMIEWLMKNIELKNHRLLKYSASVMIILFALQIPFSLQTISLFPEIIQGKPVGHFSNIRYYNEYQNFDRWITDGGKILAPLPVSVMLSKTTHQNAVAFYFPNPSIPGTKEKSADVDKYFSTSSIDEKLAIIKKYNVRYIVTDKPSASPGSLGMGSALLGVIDGYSVYRIEPATSQPQVSQ